MSRSQRSSIFVEAAEILSNEGYPGEQWVLRVHAPKLAAAAAPGCFAHVTCDPLLAMRRPLSLMRVDAKAGWAEFLYKRVGTGTRLLADKPAGATLSVLGPIGNPFTAVPSRPRALLIGGGVGIPPMVFLADRMRGTPAAQPLVLMGSEVPFPFAPRPSRILIPGMPDGVIACMPLMEDWDLPSRLASLQGYAGCFDGHVTALARAWLDALDPRQREQVAIYSCGPTPMLAASVRLAEEYTLPCQVCVEEYMACAVGGCAGCAVPIRTPQGIAMRRACVDGPVFDGHSVVWP